MARKVSPGEPIRPHMTASWFNSTLNKPQVPKSPRPTDLRLHNEDHAVFVPSVSYPTAERFTAVAPVSRVDTDYPTYTSRSINVDKDSLDKNNWLVTQEELSEDYTDGVIVYHGLTYAAVELLEDHHEYVDLDETTKELVSSNGGKGRILVRGATYSLIVLSASNASSMRMFRYRLNEASLAPDTTTATLVSLLTGDDLETVELEDPLSFMEDQILNDEGFCFLQDGKYYALQAPC